MLRSFASTHGVAGSTLHPSPPKARACSASSTASWRRRRHVGLVSAPYQHVRHAHVRRIPEHLALGQLISQKQRAIVARRGADGRGVGLVGLHEHAPGQLSAAGAARHLLDQVERALVRTEIGQLQLRVGVDDAHQGDVIEVKALRDHLRAEQHRRLRRREPLEQALVGPLPAGSVGIHADDGHARPHPGMASSAQRSSSSTRCVPAPNFFR